MSRQTSFFKSSLNVWQLFGLFSFLNVLSKNHFAYVHAMFGKIWPLSSQLLVTLATATDPNFI